MTQTMTNNRRNREWAAGVVAGKEAYRAWQAGQTKAPRAPLKPATLAFVAGYWQGIDAAEAEAEASG